MAEVDQNERQALSEKAGMNDFDLNVALEQVKSETLGALLSIDSYKSLEPTYFAKMKEAIMRSAKLFEEEGVAPPAFLHELKMAAQVLRNEATVFEGRVAACLGMAEWLDATLRRMTSLRGPAAAGE